MLPVLQRLGFQLSSGIFNEAAMKGNLDILKGLKQHDLPWNEDTFRIAAEHGNLINMK
jgi:hypothetical protein